MIVTPRFLIKSVERQAADAFRSHQLGDLEDQPAEGREAEAPEKNDRVHCLPLLFT